MKISIDEFNKRDTDHIAGVCEQSLDNGIEINFELYCDDYYYYLIPTVGYGVEDFYDEHPEYDRTSLEETKAWCDNFKCGVYIEFDDVNEVTKDMIGKVFLTDEEGYIYGD